MQKIIVIVGATATKKTRLAKLLINYINGEIINADVFQLYKDLNIGTNKPSKEDIKKCHIHLVDYLDIDESMDIAIYQEKCNKIIKEIIAKNKIPIICGGSNLYIDAVIKGYNLNKIDSREKITYFDNWDYEDIYNFVYERDPEAAIKINKNNKKRIIRAAQLIYSLNDKKTNIDNQKDQYIYDCFIIETINDRYKLYEMIDSRVDDMIKNGWINEVKEILKKYPNFLSYNASKAIGYSEIASALINNTEIDINSIKQKTRNYAKKQLTWNRNKYINKLEFNLDKDNIQDLLNQIKYFLNN